jgi:hypothetical protein
MGTQDRRERLERLTARAADVDAGLARLAAEADSLWPYMGIAEKRDLLACAREAAAIANDPATCAALAKHRRAPRTRPRDDAERLCALIAYYVGRAAGERCSRAVEAARRRRAAGLPPLTKPVLPAHGRA